MAKIFDGFKSDKDVLKAFGDSNSKGYDILYAYVDKKDDLEPFVILMQKGSKFYLAAGNLTEYQESKQSLFDYVDTVTKKEFKQLFGSEKWYKKNSVDIEGNFDIMKESNTRFVSLLKESLEDYVALNPKMLNRMTLEMTKDWIDEKYNVELLKGTIVKVYKVEKDKSGNIYVTVAIPNPKSPRLRPLSPEEFKLNDLFKYAKFTSDSVKFVKDVQDREKAEIEKISGEADELFKQLEDAVRAHDKTYQYSDDPSAFRKGASEMVTINALVSKLRKVDSKKVDIVLKKLQ